MRTKNLFLENGVPPRSQLRGLLYAPACVENSAFTSGNSTGCTAPTFGLAQSFKRTVLTGAYSAQSNTSEMGVPKNSLSTRRYIITGSRRASNYWWASVVSLGGLAFLLTGFAAFLNTSLFLFNQSQSISFLPQGLIMCFYGSLGLLFGIYLWCTILWGVGNGFNEFNKEKGLIRIFRWGLPGRNRRIDLMYRIEQVEGVRVELKEGVNPRRTISLKLKPNSSTSIRKDGGSKATYIPLTRIGQVMGLQDIESEASELARFLQVPLDSFYEL